MDEQGGVNVLGFRIPVLVAISALVGAVALLLSYVARLFPGRNDANSKGKQRFVYLSMRNIFSASFFFIFLNPFFFLFYSNFAFRICESSP